MKDFMFIKLIDEDKNETLIEGTSIQKIEENANGIFIKSSDNGDGYLIENEESCYTSLVFGYNGGTSSYNITQKDLHNFFVNYQNYRVHGNKFGFISYQAGANGGMDAIIEIHLKSGEICILCAMQASDDANVLAAAQRQISTFKQTRNIKSTFNVIDEVDIPRKDGKKTKLYILLEK